MTGQFTEKKTGTTYTASGVRRWMRAHLRHLEYESAADLCASALTNFFGAVDYDERTRGRFVEWSIEEYDNALAATTDASDSKKEQRT